MSSRSCREAYEPPAIADVCRHGRSSARAPKEARGRRCSAGTTHEYETANLRGPQKQITRARTTLEAAQAAYEAAKRDVQRLDDEAEEVVQAQVRAAYM